MQRKLSVLFIIMLLFQTMVTGVAPAMVKAEGNQQSIFTNSTLKDSGGNEVQLENVEDGQPLRLHVDWAVEGRALTAGSQESLKLPEELQIVELQEGELGEDSQIIGTYQAGIDGKVTVRFSEGVEEFSDSNGTITVQAVKRLNTNTEENEVVEEPSENANDTSSSAEGSKNDSSAEADGKVDKPEVEAEKSKESEPESEATDERNQSSSEQKAADEAVEAASNESQINVEEKSGFTLELGQVTDLEGNPYTEESLLDPKDEFQLKLDWSLQNGHTYVAGDKKTFYLPKGIKIIEEITGELKDASGLTVASYKITTDKKVELTFTDFVENNSNVSGWLQIISKLDEENVDVEDGEAILDPIGEEGEIRIPIVQGSKEKTIEKKGTPNKSYNADEIKWEVIINKNKTALTNAKVTDILPEGTEYKEGSLKVIKLKVDLYGNVLGDLEEVSVTGETVANGELTIPLGNIKDAYRVEYVTTVTDDEKRKFTNNATLADEALENVSAKSTATINRGAAIKKKAAKSYNPKTGIIEWEIEFNYNEKNLTDVTLKDAWTPAGKLELVENSLEFAEMEIDENGKATATGQVGLPEGAVLVPGVDQFEVTGISTNKPYKVTYQTKVKDRVLDPFEVANTAGFATETAGAGTHVGTYYGSKSAGTVDYKNKTIDWKIELNHDEFPMEKISITDTLGAGLTLKEATLQITVDGKAYNGEYTLSGDNPFTITFPDSFTTDKKIVITYQTAFNADEVPNQKPTNKASITWTPEGENNSITRDVEAGTELNDNTKNNDWKNGSYDPASKEITWTIYTNYRENTIGNLVVMDAPQGNQKIVMDSVVVTELEIAENGQITEGDTLDPSVATIDEAANTLKVNIGSTSKAYKIQYKTSLAGLSDIQKEYVNKAEVLDGSEKLSDLTAKVGIAKSDTYGEKSGYQEGKQVHWSVKVNLGQQKITNLQLVDTISANQEYLPDTIKVYEATVDKNGNATKGQEVPADQYELTHTQGEPVFTVKWKNEVRRAYIVEYSTLFFEKHNGVVTNSFNVTGDQIIEGGKTDGDGTVTIQQLSSGGGTGEAGYLVIDKTGKKDGVEAPLAGAVFDLIDADTGNVLKTGTTDENGHIDFGRLLFGQYELHERIVPEGYVTNDERQRIEINQKYEQGNDKTAYAYEVLNFEPVFAIELSKTDNKNNPLAGAEFTLYDATDNELAKATTNENGIIRFEELPKAGTYYVQETKAPEGFILDQTKHKVIIGEKEPEPVNVSIKNTPRGAVLLMKIDKDTKEPLAGVEFELQKLNIDGDYVTIDTFTTDENGYIQTSNTLEAGSYQFVETKALDGYRSNEEAIQFDVDVTNPNTQTFTMQNEKYKGSIKLIKQDAATEDLLPGAEFKLMDAKGNVIKEKLVTNEQGEIVIDDLLLGEYQLIETKAPAGYELDETPIVVTISHDKQVVEKIVSNHQITDIPVEKKWNNAGGDTTPVTVKLLPTDKTVELNKENNWKATFKDVHVYDASGKEINYQVEEREVAGYKATITGNQETGFIITNTELTNISGTKQWLDDNSVDRPERIVVNLLQNGEKINTTEVTAATDWKYSFTDVPKYDENGEVYAYTVEEESVKGYETSVNGFDITNLRVGTTSVEGTKTWLDDNSENRPEVITVHLLANGEKTGSYVEVTAETDWKYAFTNLDKYDEQGKEIAYTVEEEAVEGYETYIDGNDITNLRVGKTEVEITKLWKDEDERIRPDSITVNLLQNGEVYGEYKVIKENEWKQTITDLPKYDEFGKAYVYTVTEHDVPGYASAIDGFEITNTRADLKTIQVTKTWLDDDSEDRPESIEVELFRSITNGKQQFVDTFTVKANEDWSLEINDLPAFDEEGRAYTYEIKEKEVEGYETSINGFDITNLRVGTTSVEGTKTWKDGHEGDRPNMITVHLLQNGEKIATKEVSAEDNWKYSFTNLPAFDENGVAYAYTVEEDAVEGYETTIDGYDITNLRVGTTMVEGEKIWKGDNEKNRPGSIKVILLANGKEVDRQEVTEDMNWHYSFTNLPQFDENGKTINYAVEEVSVPGYDTEINGFTIINTWIPVKPVTPDSSDDTKDPEQPSISGEANGSGSKLPDTATDMFNFIMLGAGLLLIGLALWIYNRKFARN